MSEHCPGCNVDLDGGPIPDNIRQHYSPPFRWSRTIGISNGESIIAWKCPDCGWTWPRNGSQSSGIREGKS